MVLLRRVVPYPSEPKLSRSAMASSPDGVAHGVPKRKRKWSLVVGRSRRLRIAFLADSSEDLHHCAVSQICRMRVRLPLRICLNMGSNSADPGGLTTAVFIL